MKTVCIYHSIDLDGWMSAAIVKHWVWLNNEPPINFIGYNHGQPIPDLSEYDKVIMCDISFSDNGKVSQEMLDLFDMNTLTDKRFIWLDHHDSAHKLYWKSGVNYFIYGLLDTKLAACELTWMYLFPNETMPEIVRLLGRYDCFGHKGTDEELKVLMFQYGARQVINDIDGAYEYLIKSMNDENTHSGTNWGILRQGKSIYQYLCTEAKQVYKSGFEIHFYWAKDIGRLNNVPKQCHAKFICINKERFNPINFGIDYHSEGYDGAACFHYDGVAKLWRFSLYNDNSEVDCSIIAKQYGGGGHKGAAGFVVKNINEIIK